MVKLGRIKINHYRNVCPGTELRLDARINLVLGDSGTGKTTLLGLLAAIAGSDFSRLEHEPFDLAYDVGDGIFTATVVIRGGGPSARSATDGLPEPTDYAYRVGITRVGGEQVCEIHGTPASLIVQVTGAEPHHGLPSAPFRRGFLTAALRHPPAAALFFTAWNLFNWNGTAARFDESLDCFLAMTGRGAALAGEALPVPAEAAFTFDQRSALRASTLYSIDRYLPVGAIDRAIVEAHRSPAGELQISLAADDPDAEPPSAALASLGFLRRAAQVLGFRGTSFHPDIASHRYARATGEHVYAVRGFTFRFTRADGTTLHHDLLSYGQKRLLAFFYYLAASEQFAIADELVHGIHHAWIEACIQAIGPRQAFLTSQDPRLLTHLGLDSLAQVLARLITCEIVVVEGVEQLQWRNITADAAIAFFRQHAREMARLDRILDPPLPAASTTTTASD